MSKQVVRTFSGIKLRHDTENGNRWVSLDGKLEVQENHIGVKFEKWSVETHPIHPRFRGSGWNLRAALSNSGLGDNADPTILKQIKKYDQRDR